MQSKAPGVGTTPEDCGTGAGAKETLCARRSMPRSSARQWLVLGAASAGASAALTGAILFSPVIATASADDSGATTSAAAERRPDSNDVDRGTDTDTTTPSTADKSPQRSKPNLRDDDSHAVDGASSGDDVDDSTDSDVAAADDVVRTAVRKPLRRNDGPPTAHTETSPRATADDMDRDPVQGSADVPLTAAAATPSDTSTRSPQHDQPAVAGARPDVLPTVLDLVRYTLFNRSPTLAPGLQTTRADGSISANLNGNSRNGFALTYTVRRGPRLGTVAIDDSTGQFVYTPGPTLTAAHPVDSFTIAVSNGEHARLRGILGLVQHAIHLGARFLGWAESDTTTTTVRVTPGAASVLAAAVQRAESTVARIYTTAGHGTGVVIRADGQVLTAFHVVSEASDVSVVVAGRRYAADLVGFDRGNDVAVLQMRGAAGLGAISPAAGAGVHPGQWVAALGNAGGAGQPLTRGIGSVVALDRTDTFLHPAYNEQVTQTGLIETSISRNPGDSGGPLVDSNADLVGILTSAEFDDDTGAPKPRSFVIPISTALSVVGAVDRQVGTATIHVGSQAKLGVAMNPSTPGRDGIPIHDVAVGSAAYLIGLRAGDRLTGLDGETVSSPLTVLRILDRYYPGDLIDVRWTDSAGSAYAEKARLG